MKQTYAKLFEPFTLKNGVTVKNRLVVAPLTHFGSDEAGHLTDIERAFLGERATDVGLFVTACYLVQTGGRAFTGQPFAISEADLPSMREVARILRDQGALAVMQIQHGGARVTPELNGGDLPRVPSELPGTPSRAFTSREVESLVESFANAARLAMRAGFDGVEIHGANNYLVQQFYSGATNLRADAWGGTRQKRMRFPLAIVDAVLEARKAEGRPSFIVGYRLSPEEPFENGLTMQDTFELVDALCGRDIDYIHVSLHDFYSKAKRGAPADYRLKLIGERVAGRTALIGLGDLVTADRLAKALATRWTDFVAIGRTAVATPHAASLIATGREEELSAEIDPARKSFYHIPEPLWKLIMADDMGWLPRVKKP